MPIVGWFCTSCDKEVAFGHFLRDCPKPPIPPPFEGILLDSLTAEASHPGHSGLTISATGLLDCPRSTFIERLWDSRPMPQSLFAPEAGAILHHALAKAAIKYGLAMPEEPLGPVWLVGLSDLIDSPIHMTPDLRYPAKLDDYKFINSMSIRYVPRTEPSSDHVIQWNIYRHGEEQERGGKIESGTVWYASLLSRRDAAAIGGPFLRREPMMLSLEEIAEYQPSEGKATVAEIGKLLSAAFKRVAAGEAKETVLESMPLTGLSMMPDKKTGASNKCTKACSFSDTCSLHGGGEFVKTGFGPEATPEDETGGILDLDIDGGGNEDF